MIEAGKRQNNMPFITATGKILTIDYYSILEKDYKALRRLEQMYTRVANNCGPLLLEIQTVLQNYTMRKNSLANLDLEIPITLQPNPILNSNNTIDSTADFVTSNISGANEDEKWKSLLKYLEAIKDRMAPETDGSSSGDSFDFDAFFE